MKKLLILDMKNYTCNMPINERFAVRAIIRKGNLFAMQRGKNGEYKIPGGGIEANETLVQALIREVLEETGLTVVTDTIKEIGEIEEIREDNFKKGTKFIAHSYYYNCEVLDFISNTNLTENELEKGYELCWVTASEILQTNVNHLTDPWTIRDTEFLKIFTKMNSNN